MASLLPETSRGAEHPFGAPQLKVRPGCLSWSPSGTLLREASTAQEDLPIPWAGNLSLGFRVLNPGSPLAQEGPSLCPEVLSVEDGHCRQVVSLSLSLRPGTPSFPPEEQREDRSPPRRVCCLLSPRV